MLVDAIVERGFDNSCVVCRRIFTDDDFRAGDVEAVVTEPPFPFGRFCKIGDTTELRLFHKGTTYHESCYYKRKYRLD